MSIPLLFSLLANSPFFILSTFFFLIASYAPRAPRRVARGVTLCHPAVLRFCPRLIFCAAVQGESVCRCGRLEGKLRAARGRPPLLPPLLRQANARVAPAFARRRFPDAAGARRCAAYLKSMAKIVKALLRLTRVYLAHSALRSLPVVSAPGACARGEWPRKARLLQLLRRESLS